MVTFPNAKINVGLNILSKRSDGYHNISSCFYPVPFADVLEIVTSEQFEFKSSGLSIPGSGNLCIQAFDMIKTDHKIGNVKIHLHKVIPIGSGLGGGSADATFTLKMLDKLFELNLGDQTIKNYAAQLGSDCPFFVRNQPAIASGTGTQLRASKLSLTGKRLVLISPGIHVSTAEAYSGIIPNENRINLIEALDRPIEEWKYTVSNDFEASILPKHPKIKEIKEQLYTLGASYASMTGSGAAVYGIFGHEPDLDSIRSKVCWSGVLN